MTVAKFRSTPFVDKLLARAQRPAGPCTTPDQDINGAWCDWPDGLTDPLRGTGSGAGRNPTMLVESG